MTIIEKLPSGVPGLDTITHGGIPRGRTTLITGRSGTCKSILSLQLASTLARQGAKTLFIAVEEEPADLVTTGDALGFDLTSLMREGKVAMLDLTRPMEGPTFVAGNYDISALLHRIEAKVKELGAECVVLDSATALFSPRPPSEYLRGLFYQLVYQLRQLGLTAVVTAEAPGDYGAQLTTLGVEDYVCDLVIVMRNLIDHERRRRSIEVHKYRRSAHYKGEYPCTITTRGLTVFPLDARVKGYSGAAERYPSGFAGLDEMTGGGLLRDSIVLVRGPSGSGKTTFAGMYARAGAARGERVIYYGFEETKPMLLRNFASLGLPLEELEKAGMIKVICRYPEAISPEDLLVDLRTGLDEFRPSLVVLDSVSSIEHANSAQGFRQFMVGVASLLREHGRSAMLTQTVGGPAALDASAPYLSTIPDAIVVLDYDPKPESMERTIRVLKMRGSAHATDARPMRILPGGLEVRARAQ